MDFSLSTSFRQGQDKPTTKKHKVPYDVCNKDLPAPKAQDAACKAMAKTTRGSGWVWEKPVFYQAKEERLEGAEVFMHLTRRQIIPAFDYKDADGAIVAQEDIQPFYKFKSSIVSHVHSELVSTRLKTRLAAMPQGAAIFSGATITSLGEFMKRKATPVLE